LLSGAPLSLGGKSYNNGLNSFANSEIEFDLKGLFNRFSATVGLDAASGDNGSVEFLVLGDGKELWRSGSMQKSDHPKPVELDINGVNKLALRTTGSGGSRTRSQADWVEPVVSNSAK